MIDHLEVTTIQISPIRVAYLRHIGPYQECGTVFKKLMAWAGPKGLIRPGRRVIGASWDDPAAVPAAQLRYDCCIEVDDSFKPVDSVMVQALPGGEYAVYRHIGPYSGLSAAFGRIFREWMPQAGRQPRGCACLEIYSHQDCRITPPEELITDLFVPLR